MKVLLLVDFYLGPSRWIWDYMPEHDDEVTFLFAFPKRPLMRHLKPLAYFLAYGWQAVRAAYHVMTKNYDLVVAWETKNGFLFALFKRLLGLRHPKFVILAFALRGTLGRHPRLARWLLSAADTLTVPSAGEKEAYTKLLQVPEERIEVCAYGTYDRNVIKQGICLLNAKRGVERYIFAGGYSHRDFETLLEAVKGLDVQVRIVAPRPRALRRSLPANVEWSDAVPISLYHHLLYGAELVVVSLQPVPFAVGLVDLLTAMSVGKAIIATRTVATVDYIDSYQNGVLVKAGDSAELRQAIENLLTRRSEAERIGQNARRAYLARYTMTAFAARVHTALERTCQQSNDARPVYLNRQYQ